MPESVGNNTGVEDNAGSRLRIFISYRWNETKDQVRDVADYLKSLGKFDVWIDTEEMFGDKNERMEEGIRNASVVVIFFNDDYQKSRDCRKEAESADRNNKPMVFVKMQRPKCQLQSWFAPIISSSIFVDYFKFKNPAEEISRHIDRALASNPTTTTSENHQPTRSTNNKLRTVKVPKFAKYQQRSDEAKICEKIAALFGEPEAHNQEGALVICGGGGIGKTTLMSQLIHVHSEFLRSQCSFSLVIWQNCFKWIGDTFDETELVRSLVDLVEKGCDYSGLQSLEDVVDYFDRRNDDRLLIVLDDVFDVRVLETLGEHCPNLSCIAVTRDVDELTARHGLVSEIYRLQELDDDEIVEMFENAYRLRGKLARDQFKNLARLCSGLPIVVSLIAARFQDCQSSREFSAEYELVVADSKVTDLKIAGPYGTVSKLFQFSIEQLVEEFRKMYYAFLLFDPVEPVDVEDLAVLWNCANPHRALVRCRQLAKKSLVRPVTSSGEQTRQSDLYLVHQILHEAAVDNAVKTHRLAADLQSLRGEIISGFHENQEARDRTALEMLVRAVTFKRRHVLEAIFSHVAVEHLAGLLRKNGGHSTKGQCFAHFLYNSDWPDNGPAGFRGVNHSYRLLRQIFLRFFSHNQTMTNERKIDLLAILKEKADETEDCFLLQLFRDSETTKIYDVDRRKFMTFLYKIENCFKNLFQLRWLESTRKGTKNPVLEAAGLGDLEALRRLVAEDASLIRCKNSKGDTPLIAAALMGHLDVVKFLLELDPSEEHLNMVNAKRQNAFMMAATYGQLEILKAIYEKVADPQVQVAHRDASSWTPFIGAAMNDEVGVMKFLLEKCPQVIKDRQQGGLTAFMQTARYGHMEALKFLLSIPNRLHHDKELDDKGNSALMLTAWNGHLEVVKLLCEEAGASFNQRNSTNRTAVMFAASHGHLDIVQYLFNKDPQTALEAQQNDEKTALIIAAERDEIDVVRFLVDKCRKVMLSGDRNREKIWVNLKAAARYGHAKVVKALIAAANNSDEIDAEALKIGQVHIEEAYKLASANNRSEVVAFLEVAVKAMKEKSKRKSISDDDY